MGSGIKPRHDSLRPDPSTVFFYGRGHRHRLFPSHCSRGSGFIGSPSLIDPGVSSDGRGLGHCFNAKGSASGRGLFNSAVVHH
ncbi:hypothetical protein FKM82_008635 [Ascaphus truei]